MSESFRMRYKAIGGFGSDRSLPRRLPKGSSVKKRLFYSSLSRMLLLGITIGVAMILFVTSFLNRPKEKAVKSSAGVESLAVLPEQPISSSKFKSVQSTSESDKNQRATVVEDVDESGYPAYGFVRVPRFPPGERNGDDGKLHIIFSSGCNNFQQWQSELLLASALDVGQRGRITRIVSGCHDKSAETVSHRHQTFPEGTGDLLVPLSKLNQTLNEYSGLYITPSFPGAVDFPWINKPSSIDFFMKNARHELERNGETIVAILDPDFLFMKPLTQSSFDPMEIISSRGQSDEVGINDPIDHVMENRPVAQRYGLEGQWVRKFSVAEITNDPNSPALQWSSRDARKYTSVGPPLMLQINDLSKLSPLWAEYMPRVLVRDHDILADMWAYSIAAAHLGLKHTTLDNYMISVHGHSGQGYAFLEDWSGDDFTCSNTAVPKGRRTPTFIHMASNFKAPDRKAGPWMFHKGHIPGNILDCDIPLIVQPPDNLWQVSYQWDAKQHAWILCNIIARLNDVLLRYKKKFCSPGFESRQLIKLVQSKTKDRTCSLRRDKWCFPLAQIEGLGDEWRMA